MLYQAHSTDAQVMGRNIQSYIAGMRTFAVTGKEILKKHGIDPNPQLDEWYNFQNFLDALKEIAERANKSTITVIGAHIAISIPFAKHVITLEQALDEIDRSYHTIHRNDLESKKQYMKVGENQIKVEINTPYPCEFDLGYLRGLVRRFAPDSGMNVDHDDEINCRKKGHESCTYWISW
jgi:predicted hydrocarbon binding protein